MKDKKPQIYIDISLMKKTDLQCLAELFEELVSNYIKEKKKPP